MLIMLVSSVLNGCKQVDPVTLAAQGRLPVPWQVFDLLVKDLDGDGKRDVAVVDHGENVAQLYFQKSPRVFEVGPVFNGTGFHPGELIDWETGKPVVVLGAEGANAVMSLGPDARDGFKMISKLETQAPRQVRRFDWPGWGPSLAVSPYANGVLTLLGGYDPNNGTAQHNVHIPLSDQSVTVRSAERISPVDIDGDGVVELLFAIAASGEVIAIQKSDTESPPAELRVLTKQPGWGMPNEVHGLDLDADGDFDLLVPDEAAPSQINVLLNDGSGHFKLGQPIPFPGEQGIMELRIGRDSDKTVLMFAAGPGAVALYRLPAIWDGKTPLNLEDIARHIPWENDVAFDVDLTDVDGDGWLDGVLGNIAGQNNVWMVFGPLWDRFSALADQGFELKNEVIKDHEKK